MRRFNILFAFVAILLSSCVTDELDYTGHTPSLKSGIRIVGAVEDYDIKSVGTRADDDIADSYISEMTMFIFKANGDLIQGYSDQNRTQQCSSAINIQRGNPTFLIDTEEGILADLSGTSDTNVVYYDNEATDLSACDIYIVANAWHQLKDNVGSITKLAQLKDFVLNVDNTLAMPMDEDGHHRGFPMIGKQNGGSFKLKKGDSNEGNAVATIPLKKLYSKVRFTMQVNADQVVAGQTPEFTISKVEVFNVPRKARLGRELGTDGELVYKDYTEEMGIQGTYTPSDYYYYTSAVDDEPFVIDQFKNNKKTIYHSTSATTDDFIEFGFYMPEHKVTPNEITYPDNMTKEEHEKFDQYYKPAGVGQSRNGDGSISPAKIATFVRIHGTYTDHNGQILGVKYDIYLGQNNSNDFTIKRNQLLNNKLVITGLTNHKGAYADDEDAEGNISIDHRVEIEDKGFTLSMERTAILDSHFEVRPLDITLSPKSQMIITIPEDYWGWVSMEDDAKARSGENSGLYANTSTARKGVRKYFTTDLVGKLNEANKGTITLSNNESGANTTKTFRIWFYIDENPNVYDKTGATAPNGGSGGYTVSKNLYRICPVEFKYSNIDKDGNTYNTKDETINFQQWNLWRVWSADGKRYYDIEHEEEYLNNYASDMHYGGTQDGMAYGLNNMQLSQNYPSLVVKQNVSGIISGIIELIKSWFDMETMADLANKVFADSDTAIHYDFYLSRDVSSIMEGVSGDSSDITNKLTIRDYSGIHMNRQIAHILKENYMDHQTGVNKDATIDQLPLTGNPKSAFAYCYNKNKRDAYGKIDTVNIRWYLPSIDEIEDIATGAYDEFDQVFQNKKYWSCQPAYDLRAMNISILQKKLLSSGYNTEGSLTGNYFVDDTDRARATSVIVQIENGTKKVSNISSAAPGKSGTQKGQAVFNWTLTQYDEANSKLGNFDPVSPAITTTDYETRTPGNLPRTEKCRIRAVYRSGKIN